MKLLHYFWIVAPGRDDNRLGGKVPLFRWKILLFKRKVGLGAVDYRPAPRLLPTDVPGKGALVQTSDCVPKDDGAAHRQDFAPPRPERFAALMRDVPKAAEVAATFFPLG